MSNVACFFDWVSEYISTRPDSSDISTDEKISLEIDLLQFYALREGVG